jgi:methylenetetrahydrofolate reductase (NADPH)
MAPDELDRSAADMTQTATTSTSIAGTLRGYSIEVNPNEPKVVDAAVARLDPGTEVFLTWIPGANPMHLIGPAARLQRAGLVPVPHVGARHIQSADQLEQLAARLVGDAGVDRVLVIGGDRAIPAGPYACSLAVMRTEIFQKLKIVRMAVAGFPEGNPNISEISLNEALKSKLTFARRAGLELSIVTQFCFEAEPIVEWLRRIRARGIDVPIKVGLAGPAGLLTLARYAVRCAIGNSLRVLAENPSFAKLLVEKGPEPIIQGVANAAEPGNATSMPFDIAGLHFFVFGGFNKTVDWINAARSVVRSSLRAEPRASL